MAAPLLSAPLDWLTGAEPGFRLFAALTASVAGGAKAGAGGAQSAALAYAGDADDLAIGLVSFGFYLMRRPVLDHLCSSQWDAVYEKSVQNEIRFPTIAGLGGFVVGEIPLPNIHHNQMQFTGDPGIYHPIKEPVSFP